MNLHNDKNKAPEGANKVRISFVAVWFIVFGTLAAVGFLTLLILLLSVSLRGPKAHMKEVKIRKLLIDVDAGADDALALLLAIEKQRTDKNIEIVAITCVRGNAELPYVVVNVLKTLRVANFKVPVYVGVNSSIVFNRKSDSFFGKDGFGDQPFPDPPKVSDAEPEHAVLKMIELVMKEPGKISVVCLGPLSNLAMAIRMNENFRNAIDRLVIMGGSIYGTSNAGPFLEFNSIFDPESNFIVFNASLNNPKPIILFSWDAAKSVKLLKTWRVDVLAKASSRYGRFMDAIESTTFKKKYKTWVPADLLAVTSTLFPDTVKEEEEIEITGVTQGELRGMLRADFSNRLRKDVKNTVIVKSLDETAVMSVLLRYLGG